MTNQFSHKLAVWAGPFWCVATGLALVLLAGFVPPPKASDSAQEIVNLYTDHHVRVQVGLVVMVFAAAFVCPWTAAIATQLKRIEGPHSPMSRTQLACGAVNTVVIVLPEMAMIAASFRPERDPELIQALNDLAWLPFVMLFSPVFVQQLSIAIAIFDNPAQRVFPRWVAYFNAWCALLLVPAVLVPFFKTGPFAWQGIFEFWLAGTVFFGWILVMSWVALRAIDDQGRGAPA